MDLAMHSSISNIQTDLVTLHAVFFAAVRGGLCEMFKHLNTQTDLVMLHAVFLAAVRGGLGEMFKHLNTQTDLVTLHAVFLAAVRDGLGDALPTLWSVGTVRLHRLLQQLLFLGCPGCRVHARLSQLSLCCRCAYRWWY